MSGARFEWVWVRTAEPATSGGQQLRQPTIARDPNTLSAAAKALATGTEKTDQPRGRLIADWLTANAAARTARFDDYATGFLTQDGAPRARLITKQAGAAAPDAAAWRGCAPWQPH